jgi:hypothetical protein
MNHTYNIGINLNFFLNIKQVLFIKKKSIGAGIIKISMSKIDNNKKRAGMNKSKKKKWSQYNRGFFEIFYFISSSKINEMTLVDR